MSDLSCGLHVSSVVPAISISCALFSSWALQKSHGLHAQSRQWTSVCCDLHQWPHVPLGLAEPEQSFANGASACVSDTAPEEEEEVEDEDEDDEESARRDGAASSAKGGLVTHAVPRDAVHLSAAVRMTDGQQFDLVVVSPRLVPLQTSSVS